jgi:hypothetical protein
MSLQHSDSATITDDIKPSTIALLQYPAVDAGKFEANYSNYSTVNVTRIANSTEITTLSPTSDSWIVDSNANTYITPFQRDFDSFEAGQIGEVKGFGGKVETTQGKGSITLTDSAGNRLHNVAFVPGGHDRILSFMKI